MLPNGSDAWLQLRYAHAYGLTPFKRGHAGPMTRPPSLMMLAYSPISPAPTTLPMHSQEGEYEAGATQRLGGMAAAAVCACLWLHAV